MGKGFSENAMAIEARREDTRVHGFAGLPTFNRGMADKQFLFVNGRPVKDKLVTGAVRAAYADFLARDRHPAVALFLEMPPALVDVNVHPAKTEVRFRDAGIVRGLLIGALKQALAEAGHRASTTTADYALGRMTPGSGGNGFGATRRPGVTTFRPPSGPGAMPANPFAPSAPESAGAVTPGAEGPARGLSDSGADYDTSSPAWSPSEQARPDEAPRSGVSADEACDYPLGTARAQLHRTYIVAQTADGLVIVDQHAAHERLVYERMKAALEAGRVASQGLLIPEIVELDPAEAALMAGQAEAFAELGLVLEKIRRGCGAGAGNSCNARGSRHQRAGDRAGCRSRPVWGRPQPEGKTGGGREFHGLPRFDPGRTPHGGGGNECPLTGNGGHALFRSV